jgi:SEC-C motif domain protein
MELEKIPRVRDESLCPCKSRLKYGECCRPFHDGKQKPATAEQLMRSRYSAYFFRLIPYLVDTTHPDVKTPRLYEQILSTAEHANWRFLTILGTSKGQADDKTGKVEFIAEYYHNEVRYEHHEVSRFRRHKGLWKYVDDKG